MIEDDELRLAFYDEDDFAEEAVVTLADGTVLEPIVIIFDAKPVDTRNHDNRFTYSEGARPSGSGPCFRCLASDMPKERAGRATIVIRGKVYNLFKIDHDGRGEAFVEPRLAA